MMSATSYSEHWLQLQLLLKQFHRKLGKGSEAVTDGASRDRNAGKASKKHLLSGTR